MSFWFDILWSGVWVLFISTFSCVLVEGILLLFEVAGVDAADSGATMAINRASIVMVAFLYTAKRDCYYLIRLIGVVALFVFDLKSKVELLTTCFICAIWGVSIPVMQQGPFNLYNFF